MGIYQLEIVKGLGVDAGLRTWRNVYHLNAPSVNDAMVPAGLVADAEVNFHASTVTFTELIVSDPTKVERRERATLAGTTGARTLSGSALPIWNVIDVGWIFVSNHRPGAKYYRAILGEGDVVGVTLEAALFTLVQTQMNLLSSTVLALCAPNGDSVQEIPVKENVGMRQPKWSRRWRKGQHRAYVPNV